MQIDTHSNNTIARFIFTLSSLGYKYTFKCLGKSTLFFDHYYIFYMNLSSLKELQVRTLNYVLKPAGKTDFEELVRNLREFDLDVRKELISRIFFYQAGFKHCYFARTPNGQLAYIQWLIYPNENKVIAKDFRYRFYPLKPTQVMLENVFTFPEFRGLGLLPGISTELLTIARKQGYKNAIVYINKNQIVSINEFMKLNFKLRKIVREYKILGITRRML